MAPSLVATPWACRSSFTFLVMCGDSGTDAGVGEDGGRAEAEVIAEMESHCGQPRPEDMLSPRAGHQENRPSIHSEVEELASYSRGTVRPCSGSEMFP